MTQRYVRGAIGAAVLTCAAAGVAQTSSQTPTPPSAQTAGTQPETQVVLVGCIQRETDYRRQQSAGRGGAVGTGTGLGNEFVLVNASMATATPGSTGASSPRAAATADTPSGSDAACASGGAGDAYELTGNRERDLERFVGKRVEITGMLKRAETESAAAGTAGTGAPTPTGGFDPMGQDLRLPEVNVTSFKEAGAARPPVPEAVVEQPTAQPSTPTQTEPQPMSAARSKPAELPRTAGTLPMTGLIGLLAAVGALGIRSFRRRRQNQLE